VIARNAPPAPLWRIWTGVTSDRCGGHLPPMTRPIAYKKPYKGNR